MKKLIPQNHCITEILVATRAIKPLAVAFLNVTACLITTGCGHAQTFNDNDFENKLRPTVLIDSQAAPNWSIEDRMAYHKTPGVAVAVIVDGEIKVAKGFGVLSTKGDSPVTADTVFSVGSVSKVVSAAVTLKLHEEGKLSVDEPINTYLKSWQVPDTDVADSDSVTLRKIMSHTAGFSVHGFDDYMPHETVPTILQILKGEDPAKSPPVELILEPGTTYKYSGGGITVGQTVLSDVMDKPFGALAQEILFAPLGMDRSTFANPIHERHGNIAKAHDGTGAPAALPRGWPAMPEQAASGLWTSAHDLGLFVTSVIRAHRGSGEFLSTRTVTDMMTPVGPGSGMGPRISTSFGEKTFNHPGANDHYRAWIEGNLKTGNGVVILTNSENGNALMSEIRNAVSDSYGWKTNPPLTLDNVTLSSEAIAVLEKNYAVDRYYPTLLQQRLVNLESTQSVVGRLENGALVLEGLDSNLSLRLLPF